MPFSEKARDGDFLFYSTIDSFLPSPFSSINHLIPENRLEVLTDVAIYPRRISKFHYAVDSMDDGKIT